MNDRLDLTVKSWLAAEAPSEASPDVLAGALSRVAGLGQERYVTQRLLGDGVGRRRDVRLALAAALVALGLLGGALAIGALLSQPNLPVGLAADVIVFRANGEAGPDFSREVTRVRGGDPDLFAMAENGDIRRIVGDDVDELAQDCPSVSPHGRYLAYHELDVTTVTPTQGPVPSGQEFGPPPTYVGPVQQAIVIVALDEDGAPAGPARRIVAPGSPDNTIDCPHWSPDGRSLAFVVLGSDAPGGPADSATRLWVATPDGATTALDVDAPNGRWTFDWSPDGRRLVVADDVTAWLVPADGSPRTQLAGGGAAMADWSPDGSRIALTTANGSLAVVDPDGNEIFRRDPQADSPIEAVWSPDGTWIAQIRDGAVQLEGPDGTSRQTIPVADDFIGMDWSDPQPALEIRLLAWSPDGTRLLLSASDFDRTAMAVVDFAGGPAEPLVAPGYALNGLGPGDVSWEGPQ